MPETPRPLSPGPDEIVAVLRDGAREDWERFRARYPNFPLGKDGAGVRWTLTAASCGSPECVRWCVETGAELLFIDGAGMTVLHACIERTDPPMKHDVLAELIAAGADLDAIGYNGWAPLHVTAVRGDRRSAELLLQAGADKDVRTPIDDCSTPAEEALASGHDDLARFIRDYPTR
jgi:ankyrin repeat protein